MQVWEVWETTGIPNHELQLKDRMGIFLTEELAKEYTEKLTAKRKKEGAKYVPSFYFVHVTVHENLQQFNL